MYLKYMKYLGKGIVIRPVNSWYPDQYTKTTYLHIQQHLMVSTLEQLLC